MSVVLIKASILHPHRVHVPFSTILQLIGAGQLLPIEVASVHIGIKSLLLKFRDNLLLVLSRVV